MQEVTELPFSSDYSQALAEHMVQGDDSTLRRARELGSIANSLGVCSHEIAAFHAAAMLAMTPQGGLKEFTRSAEFLTEALQALDFDLRLRGVHFRKMAAHELRTPLTTLRLVLQVGIGRLEKGESLEPPTLHKALAQVDKLATRISELLGKSDDAFRRLPSSPP